MKFYLFSICNILFELLCDYFDLNQMNIIMLKINFIRYIVQIMHICIINDAYISIWEPLC